MTGTDTAEAILHDLAPLLAQQRRAWAARCQASGLSMTHFLALSLLEMHGPLPMSRLADELGIALPNATGVVDRMVERGIVARRHDDGDRRVVLVGLTDAGRAMIGDLEQARRDRMARLIGLMTPAQQERLRLAIRDLHHAAMRIADGPTEEPHQ